MANYIYVGPPRKRAPVHKKQEYQPDPDRLLNGQAAEDLITNLGRLIGLSGLYKVPPEELARKAWLAGGAAARRLASIEEACRRANVDIFMSTSIFLDHVGVDVAIEVPYNGNRVTIGVDVTVNAREVDRKLNSIHSIKAPLLKAIGVSKVLVVFCYIDRNWRELTPEQREVLKRRVEVAALDLIRSADFCTSLDLTL